MSDLSYRIEEDGVRLIVHVTPKARVDEVVGRDVRDGVGVVKVKVKAIPDKGKANSAVVRLIAKWLSVPQRDIRLVRGQAARQKTLFIRGDALGIAKRLHALLEGDALNGNG